MNNHKPAIICGAALAAVTLFGAVTGISPCLQYHILGVPCPLCGMTRAWMGVLGGEIGMAFAYHPLFWLAPFALLPYVVKGLYPRRKTLWIALFFIFIAAWAVRLVMFFPGAPPMDFNVNSLAGRILMGGI